MAKDAPTNTFSQVKDTTNNYYNTDKPSCKYVYFRIESYNQSNAKIASSEVAGVLVAIGSPVRPCR
jgi:hypothetical protein